MRHVTSRPSIRARSRRIALAHLAIIVAIAIVGLVSSCRDEPTKLQHDVSYFCSTLTETIEDAVDIASKGGFHRDEPRPERSGHGYLVGTASNLRRAASLCLETRSMPESEARRANLRAVISRSTEQLTRYRWGQMGSEELTEILKDVYAALEEIATYPCIR